MVSLPLNFNLLRRETVSSDSALHAKKNPPKPFIAIILLFLIRITSLLIISLVSLIVLLSYKKGIFRSAYRTGNRLGMKTSVFNINVFFPAIRTHLKSIHCCFLPVVGEVSDNCKAGSAFCTVDKWVIDPVFLDFHIISGNHCKQLYQD